jgi:hypothetical protein
MSALEQLALFSDEAFETEPMVTLNVSLSHTRREPRSTYVLPTGECPLENSWYVDCATAKHYSVRLIEHGPFISSTQPCQWGPHSFCRDGDHRKCPFNPGGSSHEVKRWAVSGDTLEHRDENGWWRTVHDEQGRSMLILPIHVWRCTCSCHIDLLAADEEG